MLCFLSSRRLKPGAWEDFRRAWEPEEWPPQFIRAYHVRSLEDENHVISFGLGEGTAADFERVREELAATEEGRQQRMAQFVESTDVDGVFEVIDEVTP
jgi:hypothetical protein